MFRDEDRDIVYSTNCPPNANKFLSSFRDKNCDDREIIDYALAAISFRDAPAKVYKFRDVADMVIARTEKVAGLKFYYEDYEDFAKWLIERWLEKIDAKTECKLSKAIDSYHPIGTVVNIYSEGGYKVAVSFKQRQIIVKIDIPI